MTWPSPIHRRFCTVRFIFLLPLPMKLYNERCERGGQGCFDTGPGYQLKWPNHINPHPWQELCWRRCRMQRTPFMMYAYTRPKIIIKKKNWTNKQLVQVIPYSCWPSSQLRHFRRWMSENLVTLKWYSSALLSTIRRQPCYSHGNWPLAISHPNVIHSESCPRSMHSQRPSQIIKKYM